MRKSICVYCGSRDGKNPLFVEDAQRLGAALARSGLRLIYGAGDIGLMGHVARSAQTAGGETFGVIPKHLVDLEVGKTDLTTYVVTETMHERKKVMFMNCDAVVVLPGGAGSLDELFEVLTWRQLGLHEKPIFLLNTAGYWNPLLALLDHVIDQGFAEPGLLEFIETLSDTDSLMSKIVEHLGSWDA
ncbi:MAG: TIGR00730 family Rossman fold protein [Pseudomonadota bacterium]